MPTKTIYHTDKNSQVASWAPIVTVVGFLLILLGCATGSYTHGVETYAKPEDEPLNLTLYTPARAREEPVPCILLIHGGAWTFGSRHQMRWYGARLAELGYIAASVDYRKLPSYGYRESVADVKAAVRWLRSHEDQLGIDAGRIVAMGNSAGGHLALMLATTAGHPVLDDPTATSAAVCAAVSLYGAIDMTVYKDPPLLPGIDLLGREFLGRYVAEGLPGYDDPYVAASPMTHAGKSTPPVLLIQGGGDKLVPPRVAKEAYAKLRELKVPTRLHIFPGQPHAFDFIRPQLRPDVLALVVAFLSDYGCPPPAMAEGVPHGGL